MPEYKPEGYGTLTPYLLVNDAAAAIALYEKAFGATEKLRLTGPGDSVMHAEMVLGDSHFMLAGTTPDMDVATPTDQQWPSVSMVLYYEDCDAAFERAVGAGCVAEQPPTDMFWGDRMAKLRDPFGQRWSLMTHQEEVSPEEMQKRMDAMFGG